MERSTTFILIWGWSYMVASPVVPAPNLKLICFYPVFLSGCSAQILFLMETKHSLKKNFIGTLAVTLGQDEQGDMLGLLILTYN